MWERVHMTVTRVLSILLPPPFCLNTVNAVCFAYRTSDFPYVLIWVSFQCKAMTTRTPASHAVTIYICPPSSLPHDLLDSV
ncbi:hypothetical protein LCGC14_1413740 [marine sediment metagenome]|uniref:Uncharacterized protein n=1 Tax=marine sediment metagenome TaxID=412755 RepID=A0A0F9G8N9_9ZZZZ